MMIGDHSITTKASFEYNFNFGTCTTLVSDITKSGEIVMGGKIL